MTSTSSIAEGLGLTLNKPPPSQDPNKSWSFWQYYKCVQPSKHISFPVSKSEYLCSKTRVPFYEMPAHTVKVRAPSVLSDTLQRQWIWWSYPSVTFWPPGTH